MPTTKLPLTLFTTWLARGERGMSSEAIVEAVTGERIGRYGRSRSHPYDAGDLGRCVKLIEQHPVVELVFKDAMRPVSPEWAALIEVWDELVDLLREERAENGYAGRTSARMREVLDAVRSAK